MAPEVLQQLDLAQGALGQDLLAEDIGDLLDGDALVGLVVYGGAVERGALVSARRGRERGVSQKTAARIPDNTVSSLAQLLGDSISLVDDEVLVKHLEHLTALEISHGGQCARCRGVQSYGSTAWWRRLK